MLGVDNDPKDGVRLRVRPLAIGPDRGVVIERFRAPRRAGRCSGLPMTISQSGRPSKECANS